MNIQIEVKNNSGLLLIIEKPKVTSLWKAEVTVKGVRKFCIYVKNAGHPELLVAVTSRAGRDQTHADLVNRLRNGANVIDVSYLSLYSSLPDEEADAILQSAGFSPKYIDYALSMAKSKSESTKQQFHPELLEDDDIEVRAYRYGWALKYPVDLMFKGVNPKQFYSYLFRQ